MKKFAAIIVIWLFGLGATYATTRYVDGGCAFNGNGTAIDCATGAGGAGAYNLISSGLAATTGANDILEVRGAHSTHGTDHKRCSYTKEACNVAGDCTATTYAVGITQTCDSTFDGFYFTPGLSTATNCGSGTPCIVRAYGWTAPGNGEKVIISNTRPPGAAVATSVGWNHCTWDGAACDCDANHQNVQIGGEANSTSCGQTWWVQDPGSSPNANFPAGSAADDRDAQQADGSITYRIRSGLTTTELTNAHTSGGVHDQAYIAGRCATATWRPCKAASDCPEDATCTANATPEIDSMRDTATANVLIVRWGAALPARPYISYNQASTNVGIRFTTGAANWILRGLTFLMFHKAAIDTAIETGNFTFDDIHTAFNYCEGCGGGSRGYAFGGTCGGSHDVIVQDSEFGWSEDEGMHAIGRAADAATVLTFQRNWVHNQGDNAIGGRQTLAGTPNGILIGDNCVDSAHDNWTGTVIDGNLIEYQRRGCSDGASCTYSGGANSSTGPQIRLEHSVTNLTISNNILRDEAQGTGQACIMLIGTEVAPVEVGGDSGNVDNNIIFNNLLYKCATSGINFQSTTAPASGESSCSSNSIYNNTCVDVGSTNGCIETSTITGAIASNLIRNNIFYSSGSGKQVNWTNTTTSNAFESNLVVTTSNPAVTWLNTGYACAALGGIPGAGNPVGCLDPQFKSTSLIDYHILTGSPAKDAGTSVGMPAGKTRSLNNPLASRHGLPQYNGIPQIGSAWDIGACEYKKRAYFNVGEFRWKRPEPWRITNASYLRKIEKED